MPTKNTSAGTPRRSTEELLRIETHSRSLSGTLKALSGDFQPRSFVENLDVFMVRKDLNPAQLGKEALLSRSFVYQLCSGERTPGRDIILRLALVLGLSVDEAQALLRSAQRGALYPRVRRDAVLIFALSRHMSLYDTDEQLISAGETPLL